MSSSKDLAIQVSSLGKCYHIYDQPHDRLKQFIASRFPRIAGHPAKQFYREFWALNDISFQIRKGETVGIIGMNGSGKSTLLQIICGTLAPTRGEVETNGRVAALLELGSGFNPEFTGRENIFMNAMILGLSREEVEDKYDDIVAFADIGDFIEQPVKTYSNGMTVRLGFAVQSQINPDILVVDEALAVGDAKFQAKCFERLRQLKERGTSILFVTHSSDQIVAHCSSAILLNNGTQLDQGEPRRLVNRYMDLLFGKERQTFLNAPVKTEEVSSPHASTSESKYDLSRKEDIFSTRTGYNSHEYRWGDGAATILDFFLSADGAEYPSSVDTGQKMCLAVTVQFNRALERPILGITIKTKEGISVYGANSETLACRDFQFIGEQSMIVCVEAHFVCRLAAGDYFVSLGIATRHGEEVTPHDRRYDSIHLHVRPNTVYFGITDLELNLCVKHIWS